MNKRRISLAMLAASLAIPVSHGAPISVGGVPGLDPNQLRITTFASGLGATTAVEGATAGGLLVATGFNAPRVVRLVDTNGDGLADGAGATVIQLAGAGPVTSMTNLGPVVALGVANVGIRLFAPAADPDAPYTDLGTIGVSFPPGYYHATPGVTGRASPGAPGSYDLFFSLGSPGNATAGPGLALNGLLSGTAAAQSIHQVTLTPNGVGGWTASGLTQVASGLRNALGIRIQTSTGDLYLADNGIDGFVDDNEPEGADTLNRVSAGDLGVTVADFGFPNRYTQYRSGTQIGGATSSLVAIQPIPDPLTGSEAEGVAGLALAPAGFPAAVSNGVFLSFFGRSGAANGIDNEENPIVYYDFGTGQYHHFVSNNEAGVYFPVGLYASTNSLFIADLGLGTVTQIAAVPEPLSLALAGTGLALMLARRRLV